MRVLVRVIVASIVMGTSAGCVAWFGAPGPGARGNHAAARILIKKESGVCKSRTIPKTHVLLKGEETQILWDIRDKGNECLPNGTELVLKWVNSAKNPTTCDVITTAANGNKNRISCDLKDTAIGDGYVYKVYLRKNGTDTEIEDPDVEIVMF